MNVGATLDLIVVLLGVLLIVVGVAQWSRPAAYIVAGVAFVALGLLPPSFRRRP